MFCYTVVLMHGPYTPQTIVQNILLHLVFPLPKLPRLHIGHNVVCIELWGFRQDKQVFVTVVLGKQTIVEKHACISFSGPFTQARLLKLDRGGLTDQWRSQDVYVARTQVSGDGAILRREAPREFFARLSTCSLSVLLSSCASSLSWVSSVHVCFR